MERKRFVPPAVLPLFDAKGKPFLPGIAAAHAVALERERSNAEWFRRVAHCAYTLAPTVTLLWFMLLDTVQRKRRHLHTLFSGQYANLTFEEFCAFAAMAGYDGVELATWGDHCPVEIINHPVLGPKHVRWMKSILKKYNLVCVAISAHISGQCVLDDVEEKHHKGLIPAWVWGDGNPLGVRKRAAKFTALVARAAWMLGVPVVNGFIGARSWKRIYKFPSEVQTDVHDVKRVKPLGEIDLARQEFADWWNPICDVFDKYGVKFALEVHPTEEGFSIYTANLLLEALDFREAFGFNFDPSHLTWQKIDPVLFIRTFPNRIYHVHMKDAWVAPELGMASVIDHLPFGSTLRSFQFRSLGRGNIDFEAILRELNSIGYVGPLSVEWEDAFLHQATGPVEARQVLLKLDLLPPTVRFDAQFDSEHQADGAADTKADGAADTKPEATETYGQQFLRELQEVLADQALPVAEQKIRFEQLRFIGDAAIDAEVAGEEYQVPEKREDWDTIVEPALAAFDAEYPNFIVPMCA